MCHLVHNSYLIEPWMEAGESLVSVQGHLCLTSADHKLPGFLVEEGREFGELFGWTAISGAALGGNAALGTERWSSRVSC